MTQRTCEDCGHEYQSKRANAKYCGVCRLFRDLVYHGKRKQTCLDCGERFAPFKSGERLCSNCDFIGSANYAAGACALCKHSTHPLLSTDIAVCLGCARDPDKRDIFTKAVAKKRQSRRSQHEAVVA